MIDFPARFANVEPSFRIPPQELGKNTEESFSSPEYSEEEINELRKDGIIG